MATSAIVMRMMTHHEKPLLTENTTAVVTADNISAQTRENSTRIYVPAASCLRERLQVTIHRLVANPG